MNFFPEISVTDVFALRARNLWAVDMKYLINNVLWIGKCVHLMVNISSDTRRYIILMFRSDV